MLYLSHSSHDWVFLGINERLEHDTDSHVNVIIYDIIPQVKSGMCFGQTDHAFDMTDGNGNASSGLNIVRAQIRLNRSKHWKRTEELITIDSLRRSLYIRAILSWSIWCSLGWIFSRAYIIYLRSKSCGIFSTPAKLVSFTSSGSLSTCIQ